MTHHLESSTPEFPRLARQVERHVTRHLERGDVVFPARSRMAHLAINLMGIVGRKSAAEIAADNTVLDTLEAHAAEAELFRILQDLGNHEEDTPYRPMVRITARAGEPTYADYGDEESEYRSHEVYNWTDPVALNEEE